MVPLRPSTLREAFDGWMNTKKVIGECIKKASRRASTFFATLFGGESRKVHDITQLEFIEFNDALSVVPAHATKRGIPLKQAVEMLEDPPNA